MFEINYKGGTSLSIVTKKTTLSIDPNVSIYGLKDAPIKGAVVLATDERFVVRSDDAKIVLDGPGEYEVGEFTIRGIAAHRHIDTDADPSNATMYRIEIGEVAIAILGNIQPKLTDDQLEQIGIVDIVVVPIGGTGYTLDATEAVALVRAIDPKCVIPVHYADSSIQYEVSQESSERFIKELNAPVEEGASLKLKSAAQLPTTVTVYLLKRS